VYRRRARDRFLSDDELRRLSERLVEQVAVGERRGHQLGVGLAEAGSALWIRRRGRPDPVRFATFASCSIHQSAGVGSSRMRRMSLARPVSMQSARIGRNPHAAVVVIVRVGFWIPCYRNPAAIVILTESAVDALSARSLRIEETREHGTVVVSTAGIAASVPPWIEAWEPKRIICAYDADSAGDRAAHRLAVNDPRVIRLRPGTAKDWNEILLRSR